MIPIAGKPLLEHQLELARRFDFRDVVILAHYRADLIQNHLGDGSRWGVELSVIVENEPLGTAGAIFAEIDRLADSFLVLYGDTMVNVDLERVWQAHQQSHADATLLLHPNNHPLDSDLVEVNGEGWITAFHNRPHPAHRWFQNLVNAGLYAIDKRALAPHRANGFRSAASRILDFGKDLFPAMLRRGAKLQGYNSFEYIKDIGTPERYDHVCAEYAAGVVQRSSLAKPRRAVFLDRDGTLIVDKDCLRSASDLELIPGVADA